MAISNSQANHPDGTVQPAETLLETFMCSKTYDVEGKQARSKPPHMVLDNIHLQIHAGEFVAL